MNRMDTILAGLTGVAVLTICFLTYQILKDPDPKVAKMQPTRSVTTPLIKPSNTKGTRSQQVPKNARKLNPAIARFSDLRKDSNPVKPMLIGTTALEPTFKQQLPPTDARTPVSLPMLEDIRFEFNACELPEGAQARLRGHAEILKSGKWDVLITGHTDRQGSVGFNLRVGQKRAEAVKDYLATLEVPKTHMHVLSLGEFDQACEDDTSECADANRRVAFSLIKEDVETIQPSDGTLKTKEQKKDRIQAEDLQEKKNKKKGSPS